MENPNLNGDGQITILKPGAYIRSSVDGVATSKYGNMGI